MLYKQFSKKLTGCPFCQNKNRALVGYKTAYLTYALAPYAKHHLLVLPKRHVVDFLKISAEEKNEIDSLIEVGARLLKSLGHKSYSVLVRNGHDSGKSIGHLHYHLIPNHRVGDLDVNGDFRKILSKIEVLKLIKELKKAVNKL